MSAHPNFLIPYSSNGRRSVRFLIALMILSLVAASSHAQQFRTNGNTNLSAPLGSVYVGGTNNLISSNSSAAFLGGGSGNRIIGSFATIPGGANNSAAGNAFAAGTRAKANNIGSFVWSDASTNVDFASTGNNQFLVRAAGGMGINTNNPGTNMLLVNGATRIVGNLQINGAVNASGATLTSLVVNGLLRSGVSNTVTGLHAASGGGFGNAIVGAFGTIPGGTSNRATTNAFAAGTRAKANNTGTFVWADSQSADFVSTGNNQFLVRAAGGMAINANNPGTNKLFVNGSTRIAGSLQVDGGIVSGTSNSTTGAASVIAGGFNNANSGTQSTIAGGAGNSVYSGASNAVIGGGRLNSVTNNAALAATVSGGEANISQASHTFIGGGFNNQTTAAHAVVAGGQINRAGGTNGAGTHSAVGGGYDNEADGAYSTVPGGLSNVASAMGSFAAGVRAKATNPYSFVWGGSPTVDTVSTNPMSYTARAPGGFRLLTGTTDVGAVLPANSSTWAALSDSNAKTDVQPVDYREILAKVASLPVTAWHYKHDPQRRYIGPMAQDFHAAFGLGRDDKTISTLDADGVTLAAIKGLVEEINEQDRILAEREAQMDRLEESIREMRGRLDAGNAGQSF